MRMPFNKNEHVNIIEPIARGLHRSGVLNRYLELGIRRGPCFNVVAPLAKEAYAVDINDCYKYIKQNKNLIWYQGKTVDFLKGHNKNKKFDLVFIDACHEHKASLNDFELVLPLVNDNGLILLHDTYPTCEKLLSKSYCADTYLTAKYIREHYNKECEIVTLPFYFGVAVVRKMKLGKHLLWKN